MLWACKSNALSVQMQCFCTLEQLLWHCQGNAIAKEKHNKNLILEESN